MSNEFRGRRSSQPAASISPSAPTTTDPEQPAIEPSHPDPSPAAVAPPQPASAPSHPVSPSRPHPEHVESAVHHPLSQPTPPGVATSFRKPEPVLPGPQITTTSLTMEPSPLPHSEHVLSSPNPISNPSPPSSAPSSSDTAVSATSARSATSILAPAPAYNPLLVAPPTTSAPTPRPTTATPILPSSSPVSSILTSLPPHPQAYFHTGTSPSAPSKKPTQDSIQQSAEDYEVGQRQGNVHAPATTQIQPQVHLYEHGPIPVPGTSGQAYDASHMQYQRSSPPQTRTPPYELPTDDTVRGIILSHNGNGAGIGAGYANSAGNTYNGSGRRQNSSPAHRSSSRTVSYIDQTPRALDRYPITVPMTSPAPVPNAKSLPTPPPAILSGPGGSGDLVVSPDAGPMSARPELDWVVPHVFDSQPTGHAGMGMQGMPGSHQPASRRGSRQGSALYGGGSPSPNRRMSLAATLNGNPGGGERSVDLRMLPTLEAAQRELASARRAATMHGWALNVAIGAQVVLGALTTGVAAATTGRQTSIATSVLGGLSTMAASYLAKARGSGEPEASALRARELESFIRDLQAFVLDHGHLAGPTVGPEHETMIARYRRRFEEIMGNSLEGVEDTMKAEKQMDEMKGLAAAAASEKVKGDRSPV